MYCCKSSSVFCLTWRPINMILRSVLEYGCPMSEQKWKMYDKESYVNFNTWSISIGLVTWIDWKSTIVFIQLHCKPTGMNTICVPPSPSQITSLRPLYQTLYCFYDPTLDGYGKFLKPHIQFWCGVSLFKQKCFTGKILYNTRKQIISRTRVVYIPNPYCLVRIRLVLGQVRRTNLQ